MLDNIRITLLKRAFVSPGELFDLSSSQVDQLLETNYGANWKVQYGIETQAEADKRQKLTTKMRPYTGKSQREKDEEFDKREKTKERKIKMKNKKGDKK